MEDNLNRFLTVRKSIIPQPLQKSAKPAIDTRENLSQKSVEGSGGAVPQKSAKPPIDTREELAKIEEGKGLQKSANLKVEPIKHDSKVVYMNGVRVETEEEYNNWLKI